jgi:hypothetical protein
MVRSVADLERFVERYRANMEARAVEVVRTDPRRVVALSAAFTPMVAVAAAIPVTVIAAVIAGIVAKATALWVGIVVLVASVVGLGYTTARWAISSAGAPARRGWRHWLPLATTIVILADCLAEIGSGGRAPAEPLVVLWASSIVWLFAFFPLATIHWNASRRALWALGPAATFVLVVFVWTQGLFWLRFKLAVSELDAVAQQAADGNKVPNGTEAGGFTVHHVDRGHIRGDPRCDVGFWITGWHEYDTRYVAHCVGRPKGGFTHLEGEWWQLKDKQPPSDL